MLNALQLLKQPLLRSAVRPSPSFARASPVRFYTASASAAGAMSFPATMRACSIQSQGDLDVIEVREIDTPKPQAGEILIKVEYSGQWRSLCLGAESRWWFGGGAGVGAD